MRKAPVETKSKAKEIPEIYSSATLYISYAAVRICASSVLEHPLSTFK